MTFDQFIEKWNGRGIDFDNYYGDQCMDLMHQYIVEVLGLVDGRILAAPAAKDVYLNFNNVFGREYFNKIDNTPTGVPQKGDIIFWGTDLGPFGHVAIFKEGDANSFKSFDQNFPTGSKCHIQDHNYTGVLGWLRSKNTQQNPDTQKIIDDLRIARDENHNKYIAEVEKSTELTKRAGDLQDENTKLKANISEVQTNYSKCLTDLANVQKADSTAIDSGLEAQASLRALQGEIEALYKVLGVKKQSEALGAIEALKRPDQELVKEVTKTQEALAEAAIYKKLSKTKKKTLIQKILNLFGK